MTEKQKKKKQKSGTKEYTSLIALALSAAFFSGINVPLFTNLLVVAAVGLFLLLTYRHKENQLLYRKLFATAVCIELSYFLIKTVNGACICNTELPEWILLAVCAGEALFIWLRARKKINRTEEPLPELFKEREFDLERMLEFIEKVEILGINAPWGEGKTLLIDHFCEKEAVADKYEVIRIESLVCRMGELQQTLISELDNVLQKNGIFSKSSKQLQKLLQENKYISSLGSTMWKINDAMSASYKEFKADVKKLDKKVLIIFDDIDRIGDEDIKKTVFAIAESLASKEIKIIYLYDEKHLELPHEYTEKYIPYVINLTRIPYSTIVKYLWDDPEFAMDSTGLDCFELSYLLEREYINFSLKRAFGAELKATWRDAFYSVRKIRIFLLEVKNYLANNEAFSGKEQKMVIVHILLLKHFLHEFFERFSVEESITETLKLDIDGEQITIRQFVHRLQKIENMQERRNKVQEVLKNKDNSYYITILSMFDYDFEIESDMDAVPPEERREYIANEPEEYLEKKEKNEKIDRIIWNVIANGASEFTNAQTFVRTIAKDVLTKSGKEREAAWEKFGEQCFNEKLWKNNTTLFRMGTDTYLPVFQSFRIGGATEGEWCGWLDFYFSVEKKQSVTVEMVENLGYCDVTKGTVFLKAIRGFCEKKIIGNMNQETGWRRFLKTYLTAVWALGYSSSYVFNYWRIEDDLEEKNYNAENFGKTLQHMQAALEGEKEKLLLPSIKKELDDIIVFIRKCEEIIKHTEKTEARRWQMRTSEPRTVWNHPEEMDRLRKILQEHPENFEEEAEKSYVAGKIEVNEMRNLLLEHKSKRKKQKDSSEGE